MKEFLDAAVGTTLYKVTGVITSVANAGYGNVNLKDFSGEVYVYGIGAKGDFEKLGLKEGDIVTLVGQRGEHSGSAQMSKAQYDSHIAVTEVTIPEFLAGTNDTYYRVSGTIKEIANATYGNMTITDGTNDLYVYGCYPGVGATGDNRKNLVSTLGIEVGDEITVFGPKGVKNDVPQVSTGFFWSLKKGGSGDSGDEAKGNYSAVTSAMTNWAGTYLIVWDNGANGTASGKDLAKTADVTISEGVIASSDAVNAAAVTVAAMEGGYSVKLAGGKYLTFTTNGNQCTFADEAAPMNFEYTSSGIKVSGVDAGGNTRYLMKNPNNGSAIFRGYKESSFIKEGSWVEGWEYPTLYKFVEAE